MNRRNFGRQFLSCIGGVAAFRILPTSALNAAGAPGAAGDVSASVMSPPDLVVNGTRLNGTMTALSRFGATPDGGVNRVAFSEADRAARSYVRELMEAAGLGTRIDAAGNLIGRSAGREDNLPVIMIGSHIDSVPNGGNYDGNVGSLGAIEVARTLHDARHRTRHPLEVVIFPNEEAGKTGSQGIVGKVPAEAWQLPAAGGETIGDGTRAIGGNPERIQEAKRQKGDIHAFLELHIEQGAILHERKIDIGIVEGIVGIRRWNVTIDGFANHAGTTPMNRRKDALVAAARFVDEVYRLVGEMPGNQVATVGKIQAMPGAPNVIAGRAVLSLEARDLSMAKVDQVAQVLRSEADRIGQATGTSFRFEPYYVSDAAPAHPHLQDLITAAATRLGHSTLRMPSGAGHDAQSIAAIAPIGMIFVPSVNGISHSPQEFTRPEDIVAGANVLLRTLLLVDDTEVRA
jgi:N-carbamoyl-L-amino-acid hydrolase